MRIATTQKVTAAFALALIPLFVMGWFSYETPREFIALNESSIQSQQVLETLVTLLADLNEPYITYEKYRECCAAHGERNIETLMLAPSVDPREIAARHAAAMPPGLRSLLRVIAGRDASSFQLASYLMFEAAYTRALIELGYRDAMQARTALIAFMSGERLPQVMTSPGVAQVT